MSRLSHFLLPRIYLERSDHANDKKFIRLKKPGLTHQRLLVEQPHAFEQIFLI